MHQRWGLGLGCCSRHGWAYMQCAFCIARTIGWQFAGADTLLSVTIMNLKSYGCVTLCHAFIFTPVDGSQNGNMTVVGAISWCFSHTVIRPKANYSTDQLTPYNAQGSHKTNCQGQHCCSCHQNQGHDSAARIHHELQPPLLQDPPLQHW